MAGEAFLASGEAPKEEAIRHAIAGQPVLLHLLYQDHRRDRVGSRTAHRPLSRCRQTASRLADTLEEAYQVLAAVAHRPVAGGTDLLVQITGEIGDPPDRVLDLWALDDLRGIESMAMHD